MASASFASYMRPIRQTVERLLETGQTRGAPKTAGTCREMRKRRQALLPFVPHPEVEQRTTQQSWRSVPECPGVKAVLAPRAWRALALSQP